MNFTRVVKRTEHRWPNSLHVPEVDEFVSNGGSKHPFIQLTGKRFSLVREHFHLRHIGGKKGEVIVDQGSQFLKRIVDFPDPLFQTFLHTSKTMILD